MTDDSGGYATVRIGDRYDQANAQCFDSEGLMWSVPIVLEGSSDARGSAGYYLALKYRHNFQ